MYKAVHEKSRTGSGAKTQNTNICSQSYTENKNNKEARMSMKIRIHFVILSVYSSRLTLFTIHRHRI